MFLHGGCQCNNACGLKVSNVDGKINLSYVCLNTKREEIQDFFGFTSRHCHTSHSAMNRNIPLSFRIRECFETRSCYNTATMERRTGVVLRLPSIVLIKRPGMALIRISIVLISIPEWHLFAFYTSRHSDEGQLLRASLAISQKIKIRDCKQHQTLLA